MCFAQSVPDPPSAPPPPKQPPRRVDEEILKARSGAKTAARKRLGIRGTFKDSTFGTANVAAPAQFGKTIAAGGFKGVE